LKKQGFLGGALVLTIATALVKVIGAVFTIPLANLLDSEGMGYFYVSYDIYSVLLIVSTAGLPVAVSRMISDAETRGRYLEVRKIFKVATTTFVVLGALGFLVMFIGSQQLANLMSNPNAALPVRVLSPAVLFVSVMSAIRGYFQGRRNMVPTAVSQVIEALCKLIVGFGLAWYLVSAGKDLRWGAAGAIFGVMLGTFLGALYLLSVKHKDGRAEFPEDGDPDCRSGRDLFVTLLRIAIPITLGASVLSLVNFIDSALVLGQLQNSAGFSYEQANSLYGIYGNARKLFNFPSAFIVPFTVSVIPALTAAIARKDQKGISDTLGTSLRVTSLLCMPAGLGISVLAVPIMNLIYFNQPDQWQTGGTLLSILGFAVILNCLVLMTNAILQAFGRVNVPVITMTVGGVIKIITNYILVGTPEINIYGAPIGTCICFGTIAVLNLIFILRELPSRKGMAMVFLKPLAASVLMAGVAWGSYQLLMAFLPGKLAVLAAIGVAVICYAVLVILMRAITKEDLMLLPKGEKIARLLHLR